MTSKHEVVAQGTGIVKNCCVFNSDAAPDNTWWSKPHQIQWQGMPHSTIRWGIRNRSGNESLLSS